MAATDPDTGAARPIRIGLVCTEELRVAGFRAVLADELGFDLVPLSGSQALGEIGLRLILIDADATLHLFALVASFRRRRPKMVLLVVGRSVAEDFVERVIGAGVKGYLSHAASAAELALAIDVVMSGSVWAPRKVLARLIDRASQARDSRDSRLSTAARPAATARAQTSNGKPVPLTHREREVMTLLAQGHANREMARLLGIDLGTVKAHLARLMRKAGVNNRTALCVFALSQGWISGYAPWQNEQSDSAR